MFKYQVVSALALAKQDVVINVGQGGQLSSCNFPGISEGIKSYYPVAGSILGAASITIKGNCSKNDLAVTVDDVACFIAILLYCHNHRNQDGTLPTARFKELWTSIYLAGDCERAYRDQRFSWIRNKLSDMGLIDWQDNTFEVGKRACKWTASAALLDVVNKSNNITSLPQVTAIGQQNTGDLTNAQSNLGEQLAKAIEQKQTGNDYTLTAIPECKRFIGWGSTNTEGLQPGLCPSMRSTNTMEQDQIHQAYAECS